VGGQRARGTATILFTDLAESTKLMARLGDEEFDALRSTHFAGLTEVVEVSGGIVVKNTGDGLLATFDSAVDALQAAVAAQQTTDRQAIHAELSLHIRVGLAVGEVSFEAGDVFGTPVVEAARLVATARPGQILCTALVRAIAGSRAGVTFSDLDPVELRGLPESVPICEVAWERLPIEVPALDLPSLFRGAGRIFVGRSGHLERLRQHWKAAGAGERHIVLLGGEPGVGKTRLATALARDLHNEGTLVLAGRCDEDLGVPYQPFVEALRHYTTHSATPPLGRHRGELVRLVPELVQLVADLPEPLRSDPETERYRLFDAVASWLSEASADQPVLLVLDDLHWAAKPTVLLLRHVLRSAEPLRLLVVATYRDTDVGRGHPLADLLADLPRFGGGERLPVTGLDSTDVAAFLEQAAGHELDEEGAELARAVWQETEGNALFVSEVVRHLVESGAVEQREGRWVVTRGLHDLGVPEGVRDVVGRRLSRLSAEANRLLACAAVVGLEFEPAVVGAASGTPEDVVLAALDEAITSRLVVESPGTVPRNRFSHALVRATIYDELSAARRVAMHRKVAEAIESLHAQHLEDHLPALTHHWARASAPAAETGRAVEYARRAGDRALAQFANDEAVNYYRQALDLLDVAGVDGDDPRRLALLLSLGEGQRRSGDSAHRATLLTAAALAGRLGDADALARSALANSRGFIPSVAGGVDADRVAALEAALAAVPATDDPVRARLLSTLALELTFSPDRDRRLSIADAAAAMARRAGDPEALAHVLIAGFVATLRPETLRDRLADAAELVEIAPSLADPAQRTRALFMAYRTTSVVGRMEEARALLGAAETLAIELGQPTLRWMAAFLRTGEAIIAGRLDQAERLAAQAAEFGRAAGARDAAWGYTQQLHLVRVEQSRVDEELASVLRDAADDFKAAGAHLDLHDAALALTAAELGHLDEARAIFDRLTGAPRGIDYYTIVSDASLAILAVRLGNRVQAQVFYDKLRPYPNWVVPFPVFPCPSVSFHLGVLAGYLGRFEAADTHFDEAVRDHQRIEAPGYLARTRLEWARMLLTRGAPGDEVRACPLLEAASAVARKLGLFGVEREARTLLGR
jgi:class 3 adenylate cyclase/tetratricopeptide (TPR) repeat protein